MCKSSNEIKVQDDSPIHFFSLFTCSDFKKNFPSEPTNFVCLFDIIVLSRGAVIVILYNFNFFITRRALDSKTRSISNTYDSVLKEITRILTYFFIIFTSIIWKSLLCFICRVNRQIGTNSLSFNKY